MLIRHGETALNRARVFQPPDTPLSPLGQQQAVALAVRLKDEPIAQILSSDLSRALQTAAPVAELLGIPIRQSELLRERNFGDLRGRAYADITDNPLSEDYQPVNGESWAQFRHRVDGAFKWVVEQAMDQSGTTLVLTHGLVIRAVVDDHLPCDQPLPERFENTCITAFSAAAPFPVSMLADFKHVADLVADGGIA